MILNFANLFRECHQLIFNKWLKIKVGNDNER